MKSILSGNCGQWHNLDAPTNEELAGAIRETRLSPADAEFITQDRRRPEITITDEYILVLMQLPVFDKVLRVTSSTALYFIITEKGLTTIHYQPIVVLKKIIKEWKENTTRRDEYMSESPLVLALHLVSLLNASSFSKIDRLMKHIEIAEDAVFHGNERKMVEEIAILTRDVLDFRKITNPQVTLFDTTPREITNRTAQTLWKRAAHQTRQLSEILASLYESMKDLRETNNSLLQHKENELLRLLSYYSIIAIPVWIFISAFNPRSGALFEMMVFWSVLGFLALWLLFIFIHFKRKRIL